MALMISMLSTGCKTVKVISADQTLVRLPRGTNFTAPNDGWFMSDALYQRYRRVVADKIEEIQSTNSK